MKTTFKYLAMAVIALMSMSACNNDLDEQVPNKDHQPVHFIMTVNGANASTRTTTDPATRETTWKENDEIGIFAYKKGTNELIKANAKYVLTGEIWKAATTADEISSADVYDYFAYYPYQAGATDPKAINISAKKDQSATSGDDYANSDVLAAQNKAVTDASTVTLTFNHVFAMVEVQVKGDKVTKQPTKVELQGINAAATLDLTAATPAAAVSGTTTGTINMFYLGATNNIHSYRAVIPTQTITASKPLVSIFAPDADGKTYNMKYSANVTYEAGKYRQLVVSIGTPQASLTIPTTSMTINPWGESTGIPGQGEEGETPVVPIITPLTGDLTENLISTGGMTATTEGWYKALRKTDEPNVTFSVADDASTTWGKVANLTYTSTWDETNNKAINNSYYIAAINYLHKTPLDISKSTIYKLTAKIKSSANELSKNGALVFMVRCATFNASFLVTANVDNFNEANFNNANQGTTVGKTPKTADTWEEAVIYVNLNKKSTTNGSIKIAEIATKVTDTTAEDYAGFDLRIYTNSPATKEITNVNANISVSDITVEPYIAPIQQ